MSVRTARPLGILDHSHGLVRSLAAALERADVPVAVLNDAAPVRSRPCSAYLGCVHIPADAHRWGAEEIRATARDLRAQFGQFAQPTQVILLLINDKESGHRRTETKLIDMMHRLDAEVAATLGITVSINAVETPAGSDCEALCERLVGYFAHSETLVSGELVHAAELDQHSICAVLSDRFA